MAEETTASVTPQTGAEPGQQAGGVTSAGAVADSTTATLQSTSETTETRFTQADLDRLVDARLAEERKKRQRQAEADKLAQAGEYQKLADQYKAQADATTVEVETLRAQLAEATAAVEATYQARLKALPREAQKAVEGLAALPVAQRLAWLDANAGLFARPTPPNINATDQGGGARTRTDAEAAELAAIYGVRAEYLKG